MRCKGRQFMLIYKHLMFFCVGLLDLSSACTIFAKLFKQ